MPGSVRRDGCDSASKPVAGRADPRGDGGGAGDRWNDRDRFGDGGLLSVGLDDAEQFVAGPESHKPDILGAAYRLRGG
jgi:hypothetical protein